VPLIDILLPEYDRETATTRRVLEGVGRVGNDTMEWKPHATSMTMGELASHVASLPTWTFHIMRDTSLDLAHSAFDPSTASSSSSLSGADLMRTFDDNVASARTELVGSGDGVLSEPWTLRRGSSVVFTLPRISTIRYFVLNHLIHHRGQLCVYLRMLGATVPAIYGPADGDGAS
jgi:uncharacterized damage-inducible protein DinB